MSEDLKAAWRIARDDGESWLLSSADGPLDDGWWRDADAAVWPEGTVGRANQVAVVPYLSKQVLQGQTAVDLRDFLQEAVSRDVPLLVGASSIYDLEPLVGREDEPWDLDVEALLAPAEIVHMLSLNCRDVSLAGQRDLPEGALYLTPIERRLADGMDRHQISYESQFRIEPYIADFLVGGRVVVEADGAGFHDDERDARRDEHLAERGFPTLRFAGAEIVQNLDGVLSRIGRAIGSQASPDSVAAVAATEELTDAQQRAVDHGVGPAFVIAPAGSGKTRVVDQRIRRLVSAGVAGSRIRPISYTNPAVNEMAKRISDLIDPPTPRTLHSIGNELAGRKTNLALAKPGGTTRLTAIALAMRSIRDSAAGLAATLPRTQWLDAIQRFRRSLRVPPLEQVIEGWQGRKFAEALEDAEAEWSELFAEVHRAYERVLSENNWTDFEGMLLDAIRLLARDPLLRAERQAEFDFWFVDEFQDLNAPQHALVRLLTSPSRNVLVVGDDDQLIMEFAGASPQEVSRFLRYPGVASYELQTNFRCHPSIVDCSTALIEHNRQRVNKTIRSSDTEEEAEGRNPTIEWRADYDQSVAEWLAGLDVPYESVAVLFRLRSFALPVEIALERAGIPYQPLSRLDFFETAAIRPAIAWLRVVSGTPSSDDWREALSHPSRYLTTGALDYLAAPPVGTVEGQIRKAVESPRTVPRSERQSEEIVADALRKFTEVVDGARRHQSPGRILDELRLEEAADELPSGLNQADPVTALEVLRRVCSYFDTVSDLDQWLRQRRSDPDFEPIRSPEDQGTDGVLLETIHGSKGREWPAVAVVGPPDGLPDPRNDSGDELEGERRIAYVAMTRAEDHLLFCASEMFGKEIKAAMRPAADHVRSEARRVANRPAPAPEPVTPRRPFINHREALRAALESDRERTFDAVITDVSDGQLMLTCESVPFIVAAPPASRNDRHVIGTQVRIQIQFLPGDGPGTAMIV